MLDLLIQFIKTEGEGICVNIPYNCLFVFRYASEGTSGGIFKSHRPSVRPSVTNRVSAISHKLLKQI